MKISRKEKIKSEIFVKVKDYYESSESQRFIPGQTQIKYAGRVFDEKELSNLVDASLEFWPTFGRFTQEFEKEFVKFLNTKYCLLTNSGSSANLLALSALTSPLLKERMLKPGDE